MSAPPPPINPAPQGPNPIQPPDDRALQILHELEISCNLNCHQIGIIQSFDPDTATAVVAIVMKRIIGFSVFSYPLLATVPVVIMRGGGGFITFPIATGDECLVCFNDRDIDAWWWSGQVDAEPNTNRLHDLSDALCFVGPLSKGKVAGVQFSTTDILLGFAGSLIDIGPGQINLTVGTSNFIINTAAPANGRIEITANGVSIKTITDALMSAILGLETTGSQTLNAGSIAAVTAVKTSFDAFYS